jgi:hypothetical protein
MRENVRTTISKPEVTLIAAIRVFQSSNNTIACSSAERSLQVRTNHSHILIGTPHTNLAEQYFADEETKLVLDYLETNVLSSFSILLLRCR